MSPAYLNPSAATDQPFDVAVIGAGVFGAWTALQVSRAGGKVILVDAYGPGNSRSSSGGESRIIRMGYGPDEIYTRMAQQSFVLWRELFDQLEPVGSGLFQHTGVLWLARENDVYCEATLETFTRCNIRFEKLDGGEVIRRYPQLAFDSGTWGILEPDSGVLMARKAVAATVQAAQASGAVYLEETVLGLNEIHPDSKLSYLQTSSGSRIFADKFVFACGPWLPQLFPALLARLVHVTRQEVFFFGVPAGDQRFATAHMPAWIDFNDLVYGIPNLDDRGFKMAIDAHGAQFDPDSGERITSPECLAAVRAYLARRVPALAAAPVVESRVCQYENTSNGDFLIDQHPAYENVWFVGGGSGHGFKHGPAVGEHVAALLSGDAKVEPRFSLPTKEKVQQRKVF